MKKRFVIVMAAIAMTVMATSCSVLNSTLNQLSSIANLANCSYNLKNISDVYVAGVSIKNVTNGNISLVDVGKLSAAFIQKKVPLTMDVNVDVTNPTSNQAALTTMDWICEIEGTQIATGTTNGNQVIVANGVTSVKLPIATDIYNLFSGKGLDSLKKFVSSFQSDGTNSSISMKVKPSINVGGVAIPSPNYITLEKKVGAGSTTNTSNSSSTTNKTTTNNKPAVMPK